MDNEQREQLNAKLDILFSQIDALPKEKQLQAWRAMEQWKSAKTAEFVGLGPMEARAAYRSAYSTLKGMGLEVGGMIEPYRSP